MATPIPALSDGVGSPRHRRHHPAACATFGFDRAVFVGASLGGITSITVAASHPELVAAIVLIDVGHRLEEDGVRKIMDFMGAHESFASLDDATAEIAKYLPHRREVRRESLTRNLRRRKDGRWVWKHSFGRRYREQAARGGDDGDWRAVLAGLDRDAAGLTCPVLVLRGSASDVLSNAGAEEVAALIPTPGWPPCPTPGIWRRRQPRVDGEPVPAFLEELRNGQSV